MAFKKIRNRKEISASVLKGLTEALEFTENPVKTRLRTKKLSLLPLPEYKALDVKKLRIKLSLTQRNLAETLGVSVKTVESWESNNNIPSGPAQRFLYLLNKKPELIKEISF
ncbi:MAG TPA: helix-turn-helix domain-containing protein [Ignavibacteria bacterium]|nr:helix-turn-helix domain-containing protein [Ignavibacteria bacterium]